MVYHHPIHASIFFFLEMFEQKIRYNISLILIGIYTLIMMAASVLSDILWFQSIIGVVIKTETVSLYRLPWASESILVYGW